MVFLVGIIHQIMMIRKVIIDLDFSTDYQNKLVKYCNSNGTDYGTYVELTKSVNKMQNLLGSQGLVHLKGPYGLFEQKNSPIIVNGLLMLNQYLSAGIGRLSGQLCQLILDSIIRFIGDSEEMLEILKKEIRNPLIIFKIGANLSFSLPLFILHWLGILNKGILNRIFYNQIYKIFVGLLTLLGIISGIFTIVLGWTEFFNIIMKFLKI